MNEFDANGRQIVENTIHIMESRLGINTNGMLLRMAWIESECGTNPQIFNTEFIGHTNLHSVGIWQITKMALNKTQTNPNLQNYRNKIGRAFGIYWNRVTMDDMRRPLYCCLAAYLYIKYAEIAWPDDAAVGWPHDLLSQAIKWKHHFNRNEGGLSIDEFVTRCMHVGI